MDPKRSPAGPKWGPRWVPKWSPGTPFGNRPGPLLGVPLPSLGMLVLPYAHPYATGVPMGIESTATI